MIIHFTFCKQVGGGLSKGIANNSFARTLQNPLNKNVTNLATAQHQGVLSITLLRPSKWPKVVKVMMAPSQSQWTVGSQTDEEIQCHKKSGGEFLFSLISFWGIPFVTVAMVIHCRDIHPFMTELYHCSLASSLIVIYLYTNE